MLPYIVYLSLVWVFILVGFKADIRRILHVPGTTETIIDVHEHGQVIAGNIFIRESRPDPENNSHTSTLIPDQPGFVIPYKLPLHLPGYRNNYRLSSEMPDRSERGPPFLLS
jgi:hypothetical protein